MSNVSILVHTINLKANVLFDWVLPPPPQKKKTREREISDLKIICEQP